MTYRFAAVIVIMLLQAACGVMTAQPPSNQHIGIGYVLPTASRIPEPVQTSMTSLALPRPQQVAKVETYSVVVNNVRAQDLLFALARDAKLNVDIYPGISGSVTLNAIDQTLQQLLNRVAKQIDMRWELDGPNLAVMPDSPFLRTYRVDYVNMSRDTSGTVTVTTQIASTGTATVASAGGVAGGGNNSLTRIDNTAKNHFWETLEKNIKDLLRETDKILPEGSSETVVERLDQQTTTGTGAPPQSSSSSGSRSSATANPASIAASPNPATLQQAGTTVVRRTTLREAASVIVNAESGIVTIRATTRQHEKIQEFIDQVLTSAKRQVLIEATIAEVQLSDAFQQGIDWSASPLGRAGFTIKQMAGGTLTSPPQSLIQLGYNNTASRLGSFTSLVKLLESFGNVKVLSSPKLSVLNNQTAMLKVVDNQVYFTIKADTTANQTTTTTTFTTDLHSVPVGFVMNVTPQISDAQSVLLNIRPSISRIIGYVADPNPALKANTTNGFSEDIVSQIPVIRTREMESLMRIDNGNIAVMGGLMEDTQSNTDDTVPGLSKLPGIGALFKNRNDTRTKTELVVFLRPIVIKETSIGGDYHAYQDNLPGRDFFKEDIGAPHPTAAGDSSP
jgi:general secretion pathway protein D